MTFYKDFLSKTARQCKGLTGKARNMCAIQNKIRANQLLLQKINEHASKCNRSKDPDKCREKIQPKIDKTRDQIKFLQQQLRLIKSAPE